MRAALLSLAAILCPSLLFAQNGAITGRVTNHNGGAPLAGVQVSAYATTTLPIAAAVTDTTGAYTLPNIPPGSYFLATANAQGFVNEVHDDIQCPGACTGLLFAGVGAFVTVAVGATASGWDFALETGGRITGRVTNMAGPLVNVPVIATMRQGGVNYSFPPRLTDASGNYAISGLPTGSYYLMTAAENTLNEVYENTHCVGPCTAQFAVNAGAAIPVIAGATVAGRDFSIGTGGSISGTVVNAITGAPVHNALVGLAARVDGSTTSIGTVATSASGEYTIGGLAPGNYHAYTANSVGLVNEIYDNLMCIGSCSITTAASSGRDIPSGGTAAGTDVDFALDPGGSISGMVTSAASSAPLEGAFVTAFARIGSTTQFMTVAGTNAAGVFILNGLPTGTYFVVVEVAPSGHVPAVLGGGSCAFRCGGADVLRGRPVAVVNGLVTAGQDLALEQGGRISGTVIGDASLAPLAGVPINIVVSSGGWSTTLFATTTSASGAYSIGGLPDGTYHVFTSDTAAGLINELYDNVPCPVSCFAVNAAALGTGIPVIAGATTAGRDFALGRGDSVRGRITDAGTGAPLPGVSVFFYNRSTGQFSAGTTSTVNGLYTVRGLVNGEYVAFTANPLGYYNEIFDNVRCPGSCSVGAAFVAGTPIPVNGASLDGHRPLLTQGIDFALTPRDDAPAAPAGLIATAAGFTARFTWSPPASGGLATSYVLEAGTAPGTTIASVTSTAALYIASGVPPGTFYVRVRARNAAGVGPASPEYVLTVLADGSGALLAPANLDAIVSGGRLTLTWHAPSSGGVPAGYQLEAGSASGLSDIATVPLTARSFAYNPVPNGVYFVRVRARTTGGLGPASTEVMIVVGNVSAPPGPPSFAAINAAASVVTLNWMAPTSGVATSYIIEAGSTAGLANLVVVNTGSTTLTATFGLVPPGTYFVRIRAVNAQGASVVSNERSVTVGSRQ